MKKSLLLLITAAVSFTMLAAPKGAGKPWRALNKSVPASSLKAPDHVDIITEQPEGTVVNYVRSGEFMLVSFYGYQADYQVGRVKVVYADDGKTVYIQDPLCYGEGVGAWAYGELNDDGTLISVPLGQYVSYNEDYDYGLILDWGSTNVLEFEDDYGPFYWVTFEPDYDVEAATYAIDPENGTITLVGSEGSVNNPYPYNCAATGLAGVWSDDGSLATIEFQRLILPVPLLNVSFH